MSELQAFAAALRARLKVESRETAEKTGRSRLADYGAYAEAVGKARGLDRALVVLDEELERFREVDDAIDC